MRHGRLNGHLPRRALFARGRARRALTGAGARDVEWRVEAGEMKGGIAVDLTAWTSQSRRDANKTSSICRIIAK